MTVDLKCTSLAKITVLYGRCDKICKVKEKRSHEHWYLFKYFYRVDKYKIKPIQLIIYCWFSCVSQLHRAYIQHR